jgi:hypothetical protein
MKMRISAAAFALCLMFGLATLAAEKEATMTAAASGTFEVKLKPLTAYDDTEGTMAGRMSLDKEFTGGLVATSKGEMLTAMTATKGSAGYVAIETVKGTLNGRKGTFVLQHSGTMNRNVPKLTITVVPDSGTGELAGLTGTMTIDIHDGKHFYEFDYSITEPM